MIVKLDIWLELWGSSQKCLWGEVRKECGNDEGRGGERAGKEKGG